MKYVYSKKNAQDSICLYDCVDYILLYIYIKSPKIPMSLALLKINLSQALHWPLVVLKRPAALDTGQAWPRTVTMARCSFQSLTASTLQRW